MKTLFQTNNVDLGSYLMLEGVNFAGIEITLNGGKPVALLKFDDQRLVCRDLEYNFLKSREKQYRSYNKFLLREIHQEIRDFVEKVTPK